MGGFRAKLGLKFMACSFVLKTLQINISGVQCRYITNQKGNFGSVYMRYHISSSLILFAILLPFANAQTWTYQGNSSCFHYGSNVQCFENGTIQQYATSQEQFDAVFKNGQETGQGIGVLIQAWIAHRHHLELERKDIREQIIGYHHATYDLNDEICGYLNTEISALNRLVHLDPSHRSLYEDAQKSSGTLATHLGQMRPLFEKSDPGILAAKDMKYLRSNRDQAEKLYNQALDGSKKIYVFSEFISAYAGSLESSQNASQSPDQVNRSAPVEAELPNLRVLAESGNADAQATLGKMYRDGSGVPQDIVIAAKWFHSAANLGQKESQLVIGELFEAGRGVTQDYVQAHMWYNLAAAAGVSGAEDRRNALATKMTPEQLSEAQKLASQWRPNTGIK
jgi:hypothetical protein